MIPKKHALGPRPDGWVPVFGDDHAPPIRQMTSGHPVQRRPAPHEYQRGKLDMALAVNAGARLDRLPISSFHYRIFWLVGAGMFFDGYDLYIAGGVLASAVQTKFSTAPQNLQFISLTFVGMTLGALITGFVGDKLGRRFTYQINLLIFGLASLAAAFAQDMNQLIACRFVQGLGLGAEIVVGYSTLTEFVPPKTRGRWLSMMVFLVVAGFPA